MGLSESGSDFDFIFQIKKSHWRLLSTEELCSLESSDDVDVKFGGKNDESKSFFFPCSKFGNGILAWWWWRRNFESQHKESQGAFIKPERWGRGQQVRSTDVTSQSWLLHNFRHNHSKELKSCLSWCWNNEGKASNTPSNASHNLKNHLNSIQVVQTQTPKN